MSGRTTVVICRSPVAGEGKTRLRRELGGFVDELCITFLQDTLAWAREMNGDLLVAYDGPAAPLRDVAGGSARLVPQVDGTLGERISAAVTLVHMQGASRVVVVGTDSPTLPAALLSAAFAGLDSADATVVPALDGGWVALGTRGPLGEDLREVTWSTETTCAQTIAALRRTRHRVAVLPSWYDVDEVADLRRLACELSGPAGQRAPRTAALLTTSASLTRALERIAA